jgi:proline dehydrogenase
MEPETIAYQNGDTIRGRYIKLSKFLLRAGSYFAFATHDQVLIEKACLLVDRLKLPPTAYEFQMLLGVGGELRKNIVESGRRMRVYVPFGSDWCPYSMHRLKENPKIAGYILRSVLRRG